MTGRWLVPLVSFALSGCGSPCDEVQQLNPSPVFGGVVFGNRCRTCHGADGTGGTGPDLTKIIPVSDRCSVAEQVLLGGRDMPAFEDTLDLQEVADVVEYVFVEFR